MFPDFFQNSSHMYLYHMTTSANQYNSRYHDASSHVLEASIKIQTEILFCKQTGLYILHAKWGLVVRGTLRCFVCFFSYLENQFYDFFKQQLFVYILKSLFRTSPNRCQCSCKHFTIWRMTQNITKTSLAVWYRAIKPIWRMKFLI